jgi:hypothetical protein
MRNNRSRKLFQGIEGSFAASPRTVGVITGLTDEPGNHRRQRLI